MILSGGGRSAELPALRGTGVKTSMSPSSGGRSAEVPSVRVLLPDSRRAGALRSAITATIPIQLKRLVHFSAFDGFDVMDCDGQSA